MYRGAMVILRGVSSRLVGGGRDLITVRPFHFEIQTYKCIKNNYPVVSK